MENMNSILRDLNASEKLGKEIQNCDSETERKIKMDTLLEIISKMKRSIESKDSEENLDAGPSNKIQKKRLPTRQLLKDLESSDDEENNEQVSKAKAKVLMPKAKKITEDEVLRALDSNDESLMQLANEYNLQFSHPSEMKTPTKKIIRLSTGLPYLDSAEIIGESESTMLKLDQLTPKKSEFQCKFGRKFNSSLELKEHEDDDCCTKPWRCEICDKKYTKKGYLKRHFREKHDTYTAI